jgi:hypothetical protein
MAKGNGAKASEPNPPDAKGAESKAPKGKDGSAAGQPELEFSAKPAAAVAAVPAAPAADPVVVVELVNGVDGVWKKLSNGKRVDLTTKEWRQELARLFTRAPAP